MTAMPGWQSDSACKGKDTTMQAYSDTTREDDPHALPDLEVWHYTKATRGPGEVCPSMMCHTNGEAPHDHGRSCNGWYWQPCFPGCLPDSDPAGPFETETEALADAREGMEPCD